MIHHTYSAFTPRDVATRKRQEVAHATWAVQPWIEIPILDSELPRMWEEEGGKRLPFIIDLFDFACRQLKDSDIVVYTNSDICVCSQAAMLIVAAMQGTEALYCFRTDFNHEFSEPIPDDVIARGVSYVGSDLYAFRVQWWKQHRSEFPDMICGRELWDAILRLIVDITNPNCQTSLRHIIYHRRHGGEDHWENPKHRYRLTGQKHNLRLGVMWLKNHGIDPARFGIPNEIIRGTLLVQSR